MPERFISLMQLASQCGGNSAGVGCSILPVSIFIMGGSSLLPFRCMMEELFKIDSERVHARRDSRVV